MKYFLSFLLISLLTVGSHSNLQAESVGENKIEDAQEKFIESAGIKVWPKKRELTLEGEICAAGSLVEFFSVTTYGHTYESVIAVKCRPSQLHSALVMIGGVDRHSLSLGEKETENSDTQNEKITRFKCQVSWDLPDRFAQIIPYESTKNVHPKKLYALTIEDPGTENEWLMLSPWKIHWQAEKGEGKILLDPEMPELLDPEDPEFYWRNHVRRTSVTSEDKIIYYYDQPDPKIKGTFKPFGSLKKIREEPRHYSVPAGDIVVSLESGQPLGDIEWIFSGSLIDKVMDDETGEEESIYVADQTGVVMQLMPDDYAVLDNEVRLPKLDNRIGTAFGVNEKICPPVKTPLVLTFKPITK